MDKQAVQRTGNSIKETFTIMPVLKGIIISYLITIPVFIIFSIILTYTDFPEKYIRSIVIITTIISILTAGGIAATDIRSKGWLNGSIVGFIYILVLYFLSSIVFRDFSVDKNVFTLTVVGVLAGAVGGIIGINLQATSRSRMRRIKR